MTATQLFRRPLPITTSTPVCPCCKRPDGAALQPMTRADRIRTMWRCAYCEATWLHRPERLRR